ncbi:hypothetical protein C7M84_005807 [Penaeus vannamei]|uniref:Uncharacterized protein n=1 Tax=Penaeus vannamei TaxID=6689 RepID=A0A3R7N2P3_PENVA|nr:hypothetical protein C7M84_005807 [Penaeus vannamei]
MLGPGAPPHDQNTIRANIKVFPNAWTDFSDADRFDLSYRGWRVKYEFLLGIVREPSRLLPDSLAKELQMVEAKRQGYAIERALVQANIDTWETMGGNKGRRLKDNRPESIRSLYEQVANLDCMLTSLETQIDVLSSVNNNLPKEFHDTFHDSGTSGHEPDSLEAIQTVVSGDMVEGGRLPPSPPDGDAEGGGGGEEGEGEDGPARRRCFCIWSAAPIGRPAGASRR